MFDDDGYPLLEKLPLKVSLPALKDMIHKFVKAVHSMRSNLLPKHYSSIFRGSKVVITCALKTVSGESCKICERWNSTRWPPSGPVLHAQDRRYHPISILVQKAGKQLKTPDILGARG